MNVNKLSHIGNISARGCVRVELSSRIKLIKTKGERLILTVVLLEYRGMREDRSQRFVLMKCK